MKKLKFVIEKLSKVGIYKEEINQQNISVLTLIEWRQQSQIKEKMSFKVRSFYWLPQKKLIKKQSYKFMKITIFILFSLKILLSFN